MKTIVICSGYFDPIGPHHLAYLHAAKELGDYLFVIVNNDKQALLKKGFSFQPIEFRSWLLQELKFIDSVIESIDQDLSVNQTLNSTLDWYDIYNTFIKRYKLIFVNGGDQKTCREEEVCKKYECEIVYGVGGEKIGSSTEILKNYEAYLVRSGKLCVNNLLK